ncbi:MAG: phosphate/phosphite/phosphonate ABC transporter substrate-binding protein [Rhodocyclales bacterium]|nr:phosphate/phosphite/phosphonate ABC transporter substrate-binding protein [Rhodocyclales bacterium]
MWRRLWWACLLFPLSLPAAEQSYTFGPVTQRSPVLMAQYWNPVLDYVSRRAGVTLVLKVAATGDQSSDATVRGEYDFVYSNHQFKPSAAAQGYGVILRPKAPEISGEIVTLEDSPVRTLRDLKGKTVGFANSQAFAGYTVPMDQLLRQGIEVNAVFGGSQEGIMVQLMAGSVVAAGVNGAIMRDFAAREKLRYRVLWQSGSFPDLAISAHPRVPRSVVDSVRHAFATMAADAEGMAILEASGKLIKQSPPYGFLPATQRDYQGYLDFYRHSVFKGAR